MYFRWDAGNLGEALKPFRRCFTKPQWRHFTTYMTGLVVAERGQKNIQDIANSAIGGRDQSSLNRFINGGRWPLRMVDNIRLRGTLSKRKGGVVILDDTVVGKVGECIEGAGYIYDPSQGKSVWGHNIVSTLYSNGDLKLPMHLAPYVKMEHCDQLDIHFKTKIQMGRELLEMALHQVDPYAFLFDEWYFCKELTSFLNSRGQKWATEAKSNRVVKVGDEWVQLKELFKSLPKEMFKRIDMDVEEKRYRWYLDLVVEMRNVGIVKIVLLRTRRNSRNFRCLVTNDIELDGVDVLKLYKCRWDVEVFYRDCKQHLGMGEYQMRSISGIVIHLSLVFLAYTLLKNAWCSPFLSRILGGIRAIGSACERLKRWVLEILINTFKTRKRTLPV